ncbi:hypothetical protein BDE02_14G138600 [Populus trichocarpa]|nr:hypothetical protein BDE02_14G138600 [Populus trichocarpa]KAI5565700.1 hypothetical protein BDE02_14G138600 [Populus trichocarpa]
MDDRLKLCFGSFVCRCVVPLFSVFFLWVLPLGLASVFLPLVFGPPLFSGFFPLCFQCSSPVYLPFFCCVLCPVFLWFSVPCSLGFSSGFPHFSRPSSGFYKAREGLVSLPPQMVGIVEERDHDRIVGIVAMICWIFPC